MDSCVFVDTFSFFWGRSLLMNIFRSHLTVDYTIRMRELDRVLHDPPKPSAKTDCETDESKFSEPTALVQYSPPHRFAVGHPPWAPSSIQGDDLWPIDRA